jgi:hypothetical protein
MTTLSGIQDTVEIMFFDLDAWDLNPHPLRDMDTGSSRINRL